MLATCKNSSNYSQNLNSTTGAGTNVFEFSEYPNS